MDDKEKYRAKIINSPAGSGRCRRKIPATGARTGTYGADSAREAALKSARPGF
jgi:hypothetical protein